MWWKEAFMHFYNRTKFKSLSNVDGIDFDGSILFFVCNLDAFFSKNLFIP